MMKSKQERENSVIIYFKLPSSTQRSVKNTFGQDSQSPG